MPHKAWHEITYPFPNLNGAAVETWEWIHNTVVSSDTLKWIGVLTHAGFKVSSSPPSAAYMRR